ncbi:MAG: OmpA family protein [Sphingomonadales bacterium]
MKLTKLFAVGALASVFFGAPAFADENNGFYLGVQGGVNFTGSQNYSGAVGSHIVNFDYDTGWAAGIVAGYDFGKFSTEFEFTRRKSSLGTLNVITDGGIGAALGTGALAGAQNPATGKVSTNSYMWNVFYNFSPEEKTRPFIGVGMGISSLKLQSIGGAGLVFVPGQTDQTFTAQAIVGVRHAVSDVVDLVFSYRFTHMDKVQFNVATSLPVNGALNNHSLMFGLIFKLGRKSPPPPPPPPPPPVAKPAPPPPPPPAPEPEPVTIPGPFLVFFDWDSDVVDETALSILEAASQAYNDFGIARIIAVGYADRSGAVDYNQDLSERRALNVQTVLARLGINANVVNISWHGEEDPRVPTADGVRERQNRRVEITLVK